MLDRPSGRWADLLAVVHDVVRSAIQLSLLGMFGVLQNFPLAITQTYVLVRHATVSNTLLLCGSVLLSLSARFCGTGGYLGRSSMWAKLFLSEYDNEQLELLPLSSFEHLVPAEYLYRLKKGFSAWANPCKLLVCRIRAEDDGVLPRHIASFKLFSRSSLIVVRDAPGAFTAFEKFCFLRQVDLVASPSAVFDREAQHLVWLWSVPWYCICVTPSPVNAIALALMVLALRSLYVSSQLGGESPADAVMREQLSADHEALKELNDEERATLASILEAYTFDDPMAHDGRRTSKKSGSLESYFLPEYATSDGLNNSFRTFAVKRTIEEGVSERAAVRAAQPESLPDIAARHYQIALAIGFTGCFAIGGLGQTSNGWRTWALALLVGASVVSAADSWRIVFRTNRVLEQKLGKVML